MKRLSLPLILLLIAAFMAPISGGQIHMEVSRIEPGLGPLIMAAVWSLDAPALSHMVLGMLVVLSLVGAFLQHRVVQLPSARIMAPLLGFFALLTFSIVISGYKTVSLASLAEWLVYGCAFFAVVTSAGRGNGPRLLMMAIFAGCVVAALRGYLLEFYGGPPGVRLFGGWQNPNIYASILLVGQLIGLGLCMTAKEKLEAALMGLGIALITLSLSLTLSKGGYVAAVVGFVVFTVVVGRRSTPIILAVVALAITAGYMYFGRGGIAGLLGLVVLIAACLWVQHRMLGPAVLRIAAALGGAALLILLIQIQGMSAAPGAPHAGAYSRVSAPASTGDQSIRYRLNLWRSSAELIKQNPAGYGLNTFQFHGAKPGIVGAGTLLAHQSFLQLAVEASPLALIFLVVFLVVLLRELVRGLSQAPPDVLLLRAAVIATMAGAITECMLESALYTMGFGLVFFMLAGIALQLSYDGSAPELVPREGKWSMVSAASLVGVMVVYFGIIGTVKAGARGNLYASDFDAAKAGVDSLLQLAPGDGEVHYLASLVTPDQSTRLAEVARAARLRPTPKYLRAQAQLLIGQRRFPQALTTLDKALALDPNNLEALDLKLQIYRETGDEKSAKEAAEQLVATEDSEAFKIRPLPEIVPLETYRAREYLASLEADPVKKADHLQAALDGYAMACFFLPDLASRGIIDKNVALERLTAAEALANTVLALHRQQGRAELATKAEGQLKELQALAALLNKPN